MRDVFFIETDKNGVISTVLNPVYRDGSRHETIGTREDKQEFIAWVTAKQFMLDQEPAHIVRVRDITERKIVENQLKSREHHLQILLDTANR